MRLNGKVNAIKRTVARATGNGEVAEEKRVYSLTVRLPDKSLEADYNYGYGNMSFILHGQAMKDFVDLGGEVDVYLVNKGEGEVPGRAVEDMRTRIYELEGEVSDLAKGNTMLKKRNEEMQTERTALHQRLTVAMEEVMRLEARLGEAPELRQLSHEEEV